MDANRPIGKYSFSGFKKKKKVEKKKGNDNKKKNTGDQNAGIER